MLRLSSQSSPGVAVMPLYAGLFHVIEPLFEYLSLQIVGDFGIELVVDNGLNLTMGKVGDVEEVVLIEEPGPGEELVPGFVEALSDSLEKRCEYPGNSSQNRSR